MSFSFRITDKDAVALSDFYYFGDVEPAFRIGDRLQLGQGNEAVFVWRYGSVVYRTEDENFLWENVAFDFEYQGG